MDIKEAARHVNARWGLELPADGPGGFRPTPKPVSPLNKALVHRENVLTFTLFFSKLHPSFKNAIL